MYFLHNLVKDEEELGGWNRLMCTYYNENATVCICAKKMTSFAIILYDINDIIRKRKGKTMKKQWMFILGVCGILAGICTNNNVAEAKKRTFTVNPKTIPCTRSYRQRPQYNAKTKQFLMIQSYLDKLGQTGGTLKLKKGTYKIPGTLSVPSNVTIELKSGAKLKKTTVTGTSRLKATKFMLQTVSSAKAMQNRTVSKYTASQKVTIKGTDKATIDLGKVKGASAIYIGHASNVKVSGIAFRNKKGGSYIWIEGSQNVTVNKCVFQKGVDQSGLKNRMAIRLETINETVNDFSGKWSKLDNTKNKGITITNNQFKSADIGVGTTKSVVVTAKNKTTEYAQSGISIENNTFTDTKKCAVYAVLWKKPAFKGNIVKQVAANPKTGSALYGYGLTEPAVTANTVSRCHYLATFDVAANTGKGKKMPSVMSVVGASSMKKLAANNATELSHYYILNQKKRITYIRNKADKNFTITPDSQPYHEKYNDAEDFSKRKVYYTFLSYMEQLEYAGGGAVTVKAGNYPVTNNICIPSNVTMTLENGVCFTKIGTTATDICYAKSIFTLVPPSKDGTVKTISGYNGAHDIKIIGQGIARINCANVKNCMGLVMGHARNILIQGVTFQNQYGSHFVELNSSHNVVFEKCTFEGFKPLDQKSHKECINIDGNDLVTDGFNYDWSAHDMMTCKDIYIRNNLFKNIGTAIGSHTYSVKGTTQLYHENVQILNNTFDGTYNVAIRALNYKNAVIKGNTFMNIQSLDDGKLNASGNPYKYVALLLRGVVNPTVTGNTFEDCRYYPIRVVLRVGPTTDASVAAGYDDSVCDISDANWEAMQNNTLTNIAKKYHNIIVREFEEQEDADAVKKPFASI